MIRRVIAHALGAVLLLAVASEAPTLARPAYRATITGSAHGATIARPEYRATITRIPKHIRALMRGESWHVGCPVPIRDLRLINLRYWGFDREAHWGRLVVHRKVAEKIARVFGRLYAVRFPIRRMRLVDRYGADDRRSMKHDNTSAFNCRWRAGQPGVWSRHAYGRAIDVNPVENPYVWSGGFSPPNAGAYVDRSDHRRGMIFHGDEVWWAFRNRGWEWGGDWNDVKDYQHFSDNGR